MRRRHLVLAALSTGGSALAAAAAAPMGTLNALAAVGSLRLSEGLPYGPHERQRFDLYAPRVPRTRDASDRPPLLVFFYGGAWNRGRRQDYRFVGEALAAQGVMVMVADYRLHPEVRYPEFVRDAARATALALARAREWGADPARVRVAGHSAGAYLAAMLALDERWLAAAGASRERLAGWVGLAGPYDFLPIGTPEVQGAFGHPDVPPDSQPRHHAGRSALPCLLAAPQVDERVDPQRNTAALARALRAAGTSVVERRYARVGHETMLGAFAWPLRALAPVLDDVVAYARAPAPA